VLSPEMEPNELRFILTWSRPDIALQSFLSVPGGCVVSDAQKTCRSAGDGRAVFDQRTGGRGPQTITVHSWSTGSYYYFVRQESTSGRLSFSKAIVRVIQNGVTTAYRVGSYGKVYGQIGKGRSWCVMMLDGGKVNDQGLGDAVCDCNNVHASEAKAALNKAVAEVRLQRAADAQKALQNLPFCSDDKPHGLESKKCYSVPGTLPSGDAYMFKLCEKDRLEATEISGDKKTFSFGQYDSYEGNVEHFTGGSSEHCDGRSRRADVQMVTGSDETKVLSVKEKRRCEIEIVLQVGAKCIQRPVATL